MLFLVRLPYVRVTVRGSEGTLSPLYSAVLQVISTPKVSLRGGRGHHSTPAGWSRWGGRGGVTGGHCAAGAP